MKYLLFSFLAIYLGMCDRKEVDNLGTNLPLDQEVEIHNGATLNNFEENIDLTMQSVVNESRCPSDVDCVWTGDAEVHFILKTSDAAFPIELHTHLDPKDTIVGGYRVALKKLDPYPVSTEVIPQQDYKAVIVVSKHN